MKNVISPLRYPGGKAKISDFMEDLILLNNLENSTLYEMYAGGAGASLKLLFSGIVSNIVLNDLDYHIYSFWYSVLNHTDELMQLINDVEINLETWEKKKYIYTNYHDFDKLEVGFASFFLNRSNRSGVFNAGPIGGKNQTGNYKIDARFNKPDLINRIREISLKKDCIELTNRESIVFLREIFEMNEESMIFLDPPYYIQGENLYFNFYKDENHMELSKLLFDNMEKNWFLTYDNSDRIRELYSNSRTALLPMNYSLQEKRKSKEVMMFSDNLCLPKQLRINGKKTNLSILKTGVDEFIGNKS